jgi:hypothetical protein
MRTAHRRAAHGGSEVSGGQPPRVRVDIASRIEAFRRSSLGKDDEKLWDIASKAIDAYVEGD